MVKKISFSFYRRLMLSVVGTVIIAFGIAFLRIANLGKDPSTAANIGISETFQLNLGNYQLVFNILLIGIIAIFDRSQFGIGTIINMSLPGYIIAYVTPIFDSISKQFIQTNAGVWSIVLFIGALFLFSFGISIYTNANLGVSPYDAVAPLFVKKKLASYRLTRSIQDVMFCIITLLFGGPIGIGTIFIALFTGFFVQYWNVFFKLRIPTQQTILKTVEKEEKR